MYDSILKPMDFSNGCKLVWRSMDPLGIASDFVLYSPDKKAIAVGEQRVINSLKELNIFDEIQFKNEERTLLNVW